VEPRERGGDDVACSSNRRARRVCNAVCNGGGHTGARPGIRWHNRDAPETPQPPTCGTHGHFVAQRGTTCHNPGLSLRILHGPPFLALGDSLLGDGLLRMTLR